MTIGAMPANMSHAVKIIVNLIWLACAVGVLYLIGLILSADVGTPAWLPFDLHDGPWVAALLKLFGVAIVTPPFAAVVIAIMNIGADKARGSLYDDPQGDLLRLRLPAGAKVAGIGLGLGLFFAIIGVLVWQNEPWGIWIFASPLMLLGLYGAFIFALIRVDFDQDQIVAMTPLFRWQSHWWRDLQEVSVHNEWQEVRLAFADGRTARVSLYFNNLPEFFAFVRAKIKENEDARTARG